MSLLRTVWTSVRSTLRRLVRALPTGIRPRSKESAYMTHPRYYTGPTQRHTRTGRRPGMAEAPPGDQQEPPQRNDDG